MCFFRFFLYFFILRGRFLSCIDELDPEARGCVSLTCKEGSCCLWPRAVTIPPTEVSSQSHKNHTVQTAHGLVVCNYKETHRDTCERLCNIWDCSLCLGATQIQPHQKLADCHHFIHRGRNLKFHLLGGALDDLQ